MIVLGTRAETLVSDLEENTAEEGMHMTAQQVGGVWILVFGFIVFASSFMLARLAVRQHGGMLALIGSSVLRWVTRILAFLLWGLGLATYYR